MHCVTFLLAFWPMQPPPPPPPPPPRLLLNFAMSTPHQSFNAVRLDKLIANDEQSTYV